MVVKSKKIQNFYIPARIVEGYFAITVVIGILWFASSMDSITFVSSFIVLLASVVTAFGSRASLENISKNRAFFIVSIAGIIAASVLIAEDLTRFKGPNWHSAIPRLLLITALTISLHECAGKLRKG